MKHATTTRREMLMGLALASTTAATATLSDAGTPDENPELLRLGDELLQIETAYLSARKTRNDIYRDAMSEWPRAPDEILGMYGDGADIERDVAGAGIDRYRPREEKGFFNQPRVGTIKGVQSDIKTCQRLVDRASKTKTKRDLKHRKEQLSKSKQALPHAKTYWSKCERIRKCAFCTS